MGRPPSRRKRLMRTSKLDSPGDRFLALSLSYALEEMWLTPTEICDAFPPKALMESLEGSPELRARLLIEAAGVHERIAPKKSTMAAAEDLIIALEEGVTSPNAILEILDPDEWVRHQDRKKIWQLLTREAFWTEDTPRAQERLLDLLTTALDQDLLTQDELISTIGVDRLSQSFSRELLESSFTEAVKNGLSGLAFGAEQLLDLIPLSTWLEHVPLSHIWDRTVLGKIAVSAGVAAAPEAPAPKSAGRKENAEEKKARARAIAKLDSFSRLPKSAERLDTTILLALEGMYTEIAGAQTDEEREECIRDAFPNPAMMEEALLAMVETLDDQVSAQSLRERGADGHSLIQLVIFEERRRANRAATSSPPPVTSSPPPSVRSDSVPPPPNSSVIAPRTAQSLPPPLPAQASRKASIPPPPLPSQARTPRAR